MGKRMRRAVRNLLIGVALTGGSVGMTPAVHAQAYDGTWSGTEGCPSYATMKGWSQIKTATIVQNYFRLETNTSTNYELIQGTVQADGSISASGQGQRRDRPVTWSEQYFGRASATALKLTGTRLHGRPCVIQLSNTRPAPYSLAGLEIARRNQAAQVEAERKRVTNEQQSERRQVAAAPAAPTPIPSPQPATQVVVTQVIAAPVPAPAPTPTPSPKPEPRIAAQPPAPAPHPESQPRQQPEEKPGTTSPSGEPGEKNLAQLDQLPDTERLLDWQPWLSKIPIHEVQFCNVMTKFYNDSKEAEIYRNDIIKNQLKKQNEEDLNSLIPEGIFDGWVVHAVEVRQAEDGSAAVVLQVPCKVLIGSYLGPDCKDPSQFEGVIPENSPLYREFAKFKHNDFVLVSGKFAAIKEPTPGALPSYRRFAPDTYCRREEAGKIQELFVIQLKSIFKMLPLTGSR